MVWGGNDRINTTMPAGVSTASMVDDVLYVGTSEIEIKNIQKKMNFIADMADCAGPVEVRISRFNSLTTSPSCTAAMG